MIKIVWTDEFGKEQSEEFEKYDDASFYVHLLNMSTDGKCNAHIPNDTIEHFNGFEF